MEKEKTKDNEMKYAVLMTRIPVTTDRCVFKPNLLVKGIVDEDGYFCEEGVANDFCVLTDEVDYGEIADEDNFIIDFYSEEELQQKYPYASDLDEALDELFMETQEISFNGKYDYTSRSLHITKTPYSKLEGEMDSFRPFGDESIGDFLSGGYTKISIPLKEMTRLLSLPDEELRSELQGICNGATEYMKPDDIDKLLKVPDKEEAPVKNDKPISIKDMKAFFDSRIIGQEDAKMAIINSYYDNLKADNKHDRVACMLIGPSGSGKTLLADTLAEYADVPAAVFDSTQLSAHGFEGSSIEDFLTRLITLAKGDVAKAERGIVVFDEIDKKGTEDNSDVSGKRVLDELLSFLQGTTFNVKSGYSTILFDTSKLNIMVLGAFEEVAKAKLKSQKTIGFQAESVEIEEDVEYPTITKDDLVEYGYMPRQFVNRFAVVAQLSGHTKASLTQILLSEHGCLMRQKALLAKDDIELNWTDDFIPAVVEQAYNLHEGARSLAEVIETVIKHAKWITRYHLGEYKAIYLTAESVKDNTLCALITKDGQKVIIRDIMDEDLTLKVSKDKQKTLKIGG